MNLHDSVYYLLKHVSDKMGEPVPLVFAYQNAPRPMKPYGSIRIDTIGIPQHEIYMPVQENEYQTFGSWRRATVELQIYGRDAGPRARRFALSLQSNSSLEYQHWANIAVGNRLFLSEVPELLNLSQYEERGIYQFELYYSDEMDDHVGIIEKVEIKYVQPPSIWDDGDSIWDDGDSIWDYLEYCEIMVEAYPPYTVEHPTPGE
jgi:hypothetical protein